MLLVRRSTIIVILAAVLAAAACLAVRPAFDRPVTWTPDALYYQARLLEFRGVDHDTAIARTFEGPLVGAIFARETRSTSATPPGSSTTSRSTSRRLAVPLAGAALYRLAGDRSLLDLSLAGYVAAILALFGLLLLRFRVGTAVAVTRRRSCSNRLRTHSSFPLTDSWGLALEIAAFAAAILVSDRGRRWLPLWMGSIALLAFTRDSAWIPVLAVGWWALRSRSACR